MSHSTQDIQCETSTPVTSERSITTTTHTMLRHSIGCSDWCVGMPCKRAACDRPSSCSWSVPGHEGRARAQRHEGHKKNLHRHPRVSFDVFCKNKKSNLCQSIFSMSQTKLMTLCFIKQTRNEYGAAKNGGYHTYTWYTTPRLTATSDEVPAIFGTTAVPTVLCREMKDIIPYILPPSGIFFGSQTLITRVMYTVYYTTVTAYGRPSINYVNDPTS